MSGTGFEPVTSGSLRRAAVGSRRKPYESDAPPGCATPTGRTKTKAIIKDATEEATRAESDCPPGQMGDGNGLKPSKPANRRSAYPMLSNATAVFTTRLTGPRPQRRIG